MVKHCERDDSRIEISPEMIEVGIRELEMYDLDFDPLDETVVRIYCAMRRVALGHSR